MTLVLAAFIHVIFSLTTHDGGQTYIEKQDTNPTLTFSKDTPSTARDPRAGTYTCSATACETCLQSNEGCFWCVSTNSCQALSNGAVPESCPHAEWHDMIYDARSCCASYNSNYATCVGDVRTSYCAWCPVTTEGKPACVYKFTKDLSSRFCKAQPDELIECSAFSSCRACSASSMCGWCDLSSTCVTINTLYSMVNDSYVCTQVTTNCCGDYTTCEECSQQSGPFAKQTCLWCQEEGKCKNYDAAIASCSSTNRMGVDYCADSCYVASSSCSVCMRARGCIWVSSYSYTSAGSPVTPEDLKPFCTRGGLNGPTNRAFFYNSSSPGNYVFSPHTFYHLSCTLTASGLINTMIGVAVFIVLAIITVLIVITCLKRRKYMALLREALAQDNEILVDSDEESDDAPAVLMSDVQAVPWE